MKRKYKCQCISKNLTRERAYALDMNYYDIVEIIEASSASEAMREFRRRHGIDHLDLSDGDLSLTVDPII